MTSHQVRWDALIAGLVFAAVSGVWATDHFGWFEVDLAFNTTFILPVLLIIGGLIGIVATLRKPTKNTSSQEILNGDNHE